MRYRFYTADVFSDRIFGGNPLAVFPNAEGLDSRQMQLVAREFNFSETVFVFPPQVKKNDRLLRIFTPNKELPFAGHPTIGTAHVLTSIGEVSLSGETTNLIFEEGIGPIPVKVRSRDGKPAYAELSAAKLPEFGPLAPSIANLAAMLSLEVSDLLDGDFSPQAVSCGVPFLFIPLRNRDALKKARLDRQIWKQLLQSYWTAEVYVFAFDPELEGSDLRARLFAPGIGIEEDPATGAAATALGGYLGTRNRQAKGTLKWVIEQGFEMGRPSLLRLETDKDNGEIREIRVGGAAVLVSEGTMEIPALVDEKLTSA